VTLITDGDVVIRSRPILRALDASRSRIPDVATVIVPGHGPAFRPDRDPPR